MIPFLHLLFACARMTDMKTYFTLIFSGAVLLALEVFVPGGVVGAIGILLLLWAAFVALNAVGGALGIVLAIFALLVGCAMLFLVVKAFPNSFVGRNLSLATNMKESHAADQGLASLVGAEGIASTVLRPSGFAELKGQRVDVVTRGENVEQGLRVRVIEVEGSRVVVQKIS